MKRFSLLVAALVIGSQAFAQTPDTPRVPKLSDAPIVVDRPPLVATYRMLPDTPAKLRLTLSSEKKNKIVDEEAWFTANGLELPVYDLPGMEAAKSARSLPSFVPTTYRGSVLVRAIKSTGFIFALYGKDYGNERYVVSFDAKTGAFRYAVDFYKSATLYKGAPKSLNVTWAIESGSILYVSNVGPGYAAEYGGKNGFITALDPSTGFILWQSAPLSANAQNFEIVGDALVCGYGFTKEPDYLLVLDKNSGKELQRVPLKSGPDYILSKGNKFYVRTYDTDYVFAAK